MFVYNETYFNQCLFLSWKMHTNLELPRFYFVNCLSQLDNVIEYLLD